MDISTINGVIFYSRIKEITRKTIIILNTLNFNFEKKIEAIKNCINKFYSKFKKDAHSQEIELLKRFNNFDRIKEL